MCNNPAPKRFWFLETQAAVVCGSWIFVNFAGNPKNTMGILRHIPNFLTLMNLLMGLAGLLLVMQRNPAYASLLIFAAAVFDLLDGMAARALNVRSELGKQLDSLADLVSFGVLPAFILFRVLEFRLLGFSGTAWTIAAYIPLLIPLFAALRLARFNIDTRQEDSFIGLPTPAAALWVASLEAPGGLATLTGGLSLSGYLFHPATLCGFSIMLCGLMVSNTRLFSLKMKRLSFSAYPRQWVLILLSVLLLVFFRASGIGMAILLYVALSLIFSARNSGPDTPV